MGENATSRGSPGKQVKYHKGGVYSRYNKRDGQTYYFIRYTLPDGRRKKEKVGTRKQDANECQTHDHVTESTSISHSHRFRVGAVTRRAAQTTRTVHFPAANRRRR